MVDGVSVDFTDILKLAADLGKVPDNAGPKLRQAVEVTSRKVKDDWRASLKGSESIPGGAASVSYDLTVRSPRIAATSLTSEIGPKIGGPGALVGMLEYGTPTTGPTGYGAAALERNQNDFQRGLEIALEQAERAAGL